jgi:hypothetical protein
MAAADYPFSPNVAYGTMPADPQAPADGVPAAAVADRPTILPWVLRGKKFPVLSVVALLFYFLLAVPAGAYGATKFFNKLKFADFKPDPDTLLYASDRFQHNGFASFMWSTPLYILIQTNPPGQSITDDLVRAVEVAAFSDALMYAVTEVAPQIGWRIADVRSYYRPGYKNDTLVGGTNNDTMVVAVNWLGTDIKLEKDAILNFVKDYFAAMPDDKYTAKVSGIPLMNLAMGDHVLQNMAFIDAIAIPTGLAVFCIATRSSSPSSCPSL